MLLTLSTTHRPATDLGYLLHKNPARAQVFDLSFGKAHVFYPEASEERCTAALLLDVDPVGLVRGRGAVLTDYVNDRPYIASSFLSVAISRVFGSALGGRSAERPELAAQPLPLTAGIAALRCGGEAPVRELFEPLGYEVALDPPDADAAAGRYRNVTLSGKTRVADLLTHLYVLIPALDDRKHYWIGDDEVEKLVARGKGWLETHPRRETIARRYLKHRGTLVDEALARLSDVSAEDEASREPDPVPWTAGPLAEQRMAAVVRALADSGASRVLDLGCGEGRLLESLMAAPQFTEIVGVDVSVGALTRAERRLKLERLPDRQRGRVRLLQGSLTYRDRRLAGYDAAAVVEALEHLDPGRLPMFEQALFTHARPETVVLTTPNREYNVLYPGIPEGGLRHPDHRFEWTRAEFRAWADGVANAHGYTVSHLPVGEIDAEHGAPTQMGVFRRCA
ncbi:MAG: 3' terminal RNA ribose 2'-O-methyltransferase Hen1 [Gammaproteobacteria bacterium]|nr:3' terminal RNA ribose 2'-O-methyltransferase Hen1 [Gammaproteobacteria bacterium]